MTPSDVVTALQPLIPVMVGPVISTICFLAGAVCGLCFSLIAFKRLS